MKVTQCVCWFKLKTSEKIFTKIFLKKRPWQSNVLNEEPFEFLVLAFLMNLFIHFNNSFFF